MTQRKSSDFRLFTNQETKIPVLVLIGVGVGIAFGIVFLYWVFHRSTVPLFDSDSDSDPEVLLL